MKPDAQKNKLISLLVRHAVRDNSEEVGKLLADFAAHEMTLGVIEPILAAAVFNKAADSLEILLKHLPLDLDINQIKLSDSLEILLQDFSLDFDIKLSDSVQFPDDTRPLEPDLTTPLMYAVSTDDTRLLDLLLAHDEKRVLADAGYSSWLFDETDPIYAHGTYTALTHAAYHGRHLCMKHMLEHHQALEIEKGIGSLVDYSGDDGVSSLAIFIAAEQPLAKTPHKILSEITRGLAALMQKSPKEISHTLSFNEMGCDSIMVKEIVTDILEEYNVEIKWGQLLFGQLSNLISLVKHLSEHPEIKEKNEVIKKQYEKTVDLLILRGAAVNLNCDPSQETPLMASAWCDDTGNIVEKIILAGADLDVIKYIDERKTALNLAIEAGNTKALKALIEAGASISDTEIDMSDPFAFPPDSQKIENEVTQALYEIWKRNRSIEGNQFNSFLGTSLKTEKTCEFKQAVKTKLHMKIGSHLEIEKNRKIIGRPSASLFQRLTPELIDMICAATRTHQAHSQDPAEDEKEATKIAQDAVPKKDEGEGDTAPPGNANTSSILKSGAKRMRM